MNPPDSEYGRRPFVLDDTTTVMIDDEVMSLIKPELVPGEKLLWAGHQVRVQDHSGFREWSISFASVGAVALFCGVLAVAWRPDSDVLRFGIEAAAVIAVLIMGCLLIAVLASLRERWVNNRSAMLRTFALTDKRAILWQPERASKAIRIISIPAKSIGSVHRREYPDGSGDVVFSDNVANFESSGFSGIADVRQVESLAKATLVDPDYRHHDSDPGEYD